MAMLSKNAFGSKEKIENAMKSGLIDEYDIVYLDNGEIDRKSTRLNSSHVAISYAVFCLKKKTTRRFNSNE